MKGQEYGLEVLDARSTRPLAWISVLVLGGWLFLRSLGAVTALPAHQRSLAELAILVLGGLLVAWASWRALARQFAADARWVHLIPAASDAYANPPLPQDHPTVSAERCPREEGAESRGLAERLIEDLACAVARGEISLTLLPIHRGGCTRELSLRAALQWRHPVLGTLGQDALASIAQHSDTRIELRRFALENSLDACRRLSLAGKHGSVRMCLAESQLHDRELPDLVRDYLADFDPSPVRLQLELPVEAFHAGLARECMVALRRAGAHPVLCSEDGANA